MARPLLLVTRLVYRGPPIAVRSSRMLKPQARDPELPLRRDVAVGIAFGALPGGALRCVGKNCKEGATGWTELWSRRLW